MKWLLEFRQKAAPEAGCIYMVIRCTEEELQGAKESGCMDFEKKSAEPWVCVDAKRFEPDRKGAGS